MWGLLYVVSAVKLLRIYVLMGQHCPCELSSQQKLQSPPSL